MKDIFKAFESLRAQLNTENRCDILNGTVWFDVEDVRAVVEYLESLGAATGIIAIPGGLKAAPGGMPPGYDRYVHELFQQNMKTRAEYKMALIGRMPPPSRADPNELHVYLTAIDKMAEILIQQDLNSAKADP